MEQSTANIVNKILELGSVVAVLLLVIVGLTWYLRYLIKRNDLLNDMFIQATKDMTVALMEFKEVLRELTRRN
jgi:hypothetical protein